MEEKAKGRSEDWLAVWIGLFIFIVSLGAFVGTDVLNWGVTTTVWTDISKALKPISATWLGGLGSLILTYVVLLAIMTVGALALKADIKKLSARATNSKMNLHDLAEDLPINWPNIMAVAQEAFDAFKTLEEARQSLKEAEAKAA